jgi:hypothetical protein
MAEGEGKENPLNSPKVRELTPEEARHIANNASNRGGQGINTADPNTPSFMVRDQSRPGRLSTQRPPDKTEKN